MTVVLSRLRDFISTPRRYDDTPAGLQASCTIGNPLDPRHRPIVAAEDLGTGLALHRVGREGGHSMRTISMQEPRKTNASSEVDRT